MNMPDPAILDTANPEAGPAKAHSHATGNGEAPAGRGAAARWRLREGTRAEHDRLDAAITALDLSTRAGYAAFLLVHAAALPALEATLEAEGIARALPDWPVRARADALAADLAGLGMAFPPRVETALPRGLPAAMGAAYVLEGSRLGNVVLERRAAAGGDAAVLANRRFLTHGTGQRLWPGFVAALDGAVPDARAGEAVGGARAAFLAYGVAVARVGATPNERSTGKA